MLFHVVLLLALGLVIATPPACFLKCVNGISHICAKNQADLRCLCKVHEAVNQCIFRFCPAEHFYSARDHFSGTCVEHGMEFESPEYEGDGPLDEVPMEEYTSEDDFDFDANMSDAEAEFPDEDVEPSEEPEDVPEDELDAIGSWSDEEELSEAEEWPEDNEVDLSELNEDVIKNYMSYFLKQKPSSRPRAEGSREVFTSEHKPGAPKKHSQKPLIVHGPDNYEPTVRKGSADRAAAHKSRYHKYGSSFDHQKQDQILRRRF